MTFSRRPVRFAAAVRLTTAVALCLGGLVALAPAAHAALPAVAPAVSPPSPPAPSLRVTLAARDCASFQDISANRARNNIQESLQDLGVDTTYAEGQSVDPATEAQYQPKCTPLPNWTFALGSGITGGTPVNPSVVTGQNGTATTQATTPLLDQFGQPTGQNLAGAVTIQLTPAQEALAQRGNSLWVQGGIPSDPFNAQREKYAFGALRCAVDNLNGDNVEWIGFPQNATHVFCFAYYVSPPPDHARIVVHKRVVRTGSNEPLLLPKPIEFLFTGNVSYNDQPHPGAFTVPIAAGASEGATDFYRATTGAGGGTPWSLSEDDPAGYGFRPVGLPTCSAPGGSTATISGAGLVTFTHLAPQDTITCTFVDEPVPPTGGPVALYKVTRNSFGGPFTLEVTFPTQSIQTVHLSTAEPDVPILAGVLPAASPTGVYTVIEQALPTSNAGTWAMTSVACFDPTTGEPVALDVNLTTRIFSGHLTEGQIADCYVENTFTFSGSITIKKVTQGGAGRFTFVTTSVEEGGVSGDALNQSATTTTPGVPVTATGDSLTGLRTGGYAVVETNKQVTPGGAWTLTGIDCGPLIDGTGTFVTLSEQNPHVTCTFTNVLEPFGTLTVAKQVSGPSASRTGPVQITAVCRDGQTFTLTAPADQPGPWQATLPVGVYAPTTCTISETANGAAPGVTVGTTITSTNGTITSTKTATGTVVALALGTATTVTFADSYSQILAESGASGRNGVLALLLVLTGIGLLRVARRATGSGR